MNKKAYSTGFTWVFGLVSIFGLGVLYIVFDQVFTAHLVPTIKGMVNTSTIPIATQTEIYGHIDKYMTYFHILPFILFLLVVIYMIIAAIRKEQESQYY
mgnify:CR=1 FL=1